MPRSPKPYRPLERELLKSVLAILKHRGIPATRLNAGRTIIKDPKYGERVIRSGNKDWPDVLAAVPVRLPGLDFPIARFMGLELKRQGKRPRDGQYAVLRALNAAGAIGAWVDNVNDAEQLLDRVQQGWRVEIDDAGECVLIPPAQATSE